MSGHHRRIPKQLLPVLPPPPKTEIEMVEERFKRWVEITGEKYRKSNPEPVSGNLDENVIEDSRTLDQLEASWEKPPNYAENIQMLHSINELKEQKIAKAPNTFRFHDMGTSETPVEMCQKFDPQYKESLAEMQNTMVGVCTLCQREHVVKALNSRQFQLIFLFIETTKERISFQKASSLFVDLQKNEPQNNNNNDDKSKKKKKKSGKPMFVCHERLRHAMFELPSLLGSVYPSEIGLVKDFVHLTKCLQTVSLISQKHGMTRNQFIDNCKLFVFP